MQKINFEPSEIELFKDSTLMKIFQSLTDSPKSVKMISDETGISRATTYRKLKKLRSKKLVKTSGSFNEAGSKNFLYSKP